VAPSLDIYACSWGYLLRYGSAINVLNPLLPTVFLEDPLLLVTGIADFCPLLSELLLEKLHLSQ
ncbi:MAG: hypothetical protein KJ558_06400, partial [Gammaproteobacteria bacterium]|nr:hypothetical protein [Gammaproteobacteria bacterium]MBU1654447.1 hypothetical protein [Gammaproteobacteria bacterium]MBU1960697.1 hypothetical protein [Gammaproteobacteria bacterium]